MRHADYTVRSLRDKRARLAGQIEAARRDLRAQQATLRTLDRVLALLDTGFTPSTIKNIRPHLYMESFRHGELSRLCLTVLREWPIPMTARDVGEQIAKRKGVPLTPTLVYRTRAALGRLTRVGTLRKMGIRRSLHWTLAE